MMQCNNNENTRAMFDDSITKLSRLQQLVARQLEVIFYLSYNRNSVLLGNSKLLNYPLFISNSAPRFPCKQIQIGMSGRRKGDR